MVRLPWQVKVLSKIVLSRLPVSYATWKRLGLFDSGQMDQPEYAHKVFSHHLRQAGLENRPGLVMLELGPGDAVSSGLIAHLYGMRHSYLVDHQPQASRSLAVYRRLLDYMAQQGHRDLDLEAADSFEALLSRSHTTYLTDGLTSLRQIPAASVDFVWSQVALEMVRLRELQPILLELRRVLRPSGICSHCIDLSDLMVRSLNNLRFSQSLWESEFMASSGFYTNRLRLSQYLELFQRTGYQAEVVGLEYWDRLPVPQQALHPGYQGFPQEELRVREVDVLLRPLSSGFHE